MGLLIRESEGRTLVEGCGKSRAQVAIDLQNGWWFVVPVNVAHIAFEVGGGEGQVIDVVVEFWRKAADLFDEDFADDVSHACFYQ